MITSNALAAFTQEVARTRPTPGPISDAAPIQRGDAQQMEAESVAQRRLDAVPPAPSKPLPRGSLLDMRV